jgi:hypothetical protein
MSRMGMMGARAGLRVKPVKLAPAEVPPVLARCPGEVFRLDEQVIEPARMVAVLAGLHPENLLRADAGADIAWTLAGPGQVTSLRLERPGGDGETVELRPRAVVLTAGAGNAELRQRVGLDSAAMQRRPLRMVMLRGAGLPSLNGHCTDGAKTRVTISSARDRAGRVVWQVGGQVAEDGVAMTEAEVVAHARRELLAVLPGLALDGVEWSSYYVDRAEAVTPGGGRPTGVWSQREGNVISAWPTKLALAPVLAEQLRDSLGAPAATATAAAGNGLSVFAGWPRPEVAPPPWEVDRPWLDVR